MIPKIYGYLAALMVILLVVGGVYAKGRLDKAHEAEVARLKEQLELVVYLKQKNQEAYEIDAAAYEKAEARLNTLSTQVTNLQEYADALEDANAQCLAGPDVDRLRDLWK